MLVRMLPFCRRMLTAAAALTGIILAHSVASAHTPSGVVQANVRDFGATGDGQTDDADAISRALAAAGGGAVFLPPGRYAVSRAIVLAGYGLTLMGAGAQAPACSTAGSALVSLTTNSTVLDIAGCTDCMVKDLWLGHSHKSSTLPDSRRCAAAVAARHRPARRGHGGDTSVLGRPIDAPEDLPRPTAGTAIVIRHSFGITVSNVWISAVFTGIAITSMANTVTILDTLILDVYGPYGIYAGADSGSRVDILQISRLLTNNGPTANSSCIWIDIGAGTNTIRLDNVGLIHGGTGVRMSSPSVEPAGVSPGRPLILIANDLEVDYPSRTAVDLSEGEEAQLSNCYLQGAGNGTVQNGTGLASAVGVGLYVGPRWSSELMVTNTRIFGNAASGVELAGGSHAVIGNNVISMNNIGGFNGSNILVRSGVSDFALHGNHAGAVSGKPPLGLAATRYGIEVEVGSSDRYAIVGNTLLGNQLGGISDGGHGATESVIGNVDGTQTSVARQAMLLM